MEQFPDRGCDVLGAHEGFAYEDGVAAPVEDLLGIGSAFDAAFADEEDVVWDLFAEEGSCFEVHGEIDEVPVVDTDDLGSEVECAVEFAQVVNFHEAFQLEGGCLFIQRVQTFIGQCGNDEEDGVGAGDDGFGDLGFVDDEIFSENGEVHFFADRFEVAQVAFEILFVGEH